MALFGRKKQSKGSNGFVITEEDEVFGYMDEVFRRRVPVTFTFNKQSYETDILLLETKNGLIRIQQSSSMRIPHGAEVSAGFPLDKTWWAFKTKFALVKDKPYLLIPKQIRHAERRSNQRTNFSPREQVKVTILEGLGSGKGVFGMAKDISIDGMSLTIEKAMNLATEKDVAPSPTLYAKGTKLAMVKINRVPGCPLIETMGVAQRVHRDNKWILAISFNKLSKQHQTMIQRFIEPRLLDFKPTRRSLKRRQELDAQSGGPGAGVGSRAGASPVGGATAPPAGGAPLPSSDGPPSPPVGGAPTPPTAGAPTPPVGVAPTPPAGANTDQKKALVIGPELMTTLGFLNDSDSPVKLLAGNTPVGIIKTLSEEKPTLMLCGTDFKGRSIFDVLEKIENMGAMGNARIVVCSQNMHAKDKIKFKMMKIEDILELPEPGGDPKTFIEQLLALA